MPMLLRCCAKELRFLGISWDYQSRWVQELEEFEADLEFRRNAEERHIGLLSVMPLDRIVRVTIQVLISIYCNI